MLLSTCEPPSALQADDERKRLKAALTVRICNALCLCLLRRWRVDATPTTAAWPLLLRLLYPPQEANNELVDVMHEARSKYEVFVASQCKVADLLKHLERANAMLTLERMRANDLQKELEASNVAFTIAKQTAAAEAAAQAACIAQLEAALAMEQAAAAELHEKLADHEGEKERLRAALAAREQKEDWMDTILDVRGRGVDGGVSMANATCSALW